jgi:hypothetical protein
MRRRSFVCWGCSRSKSCRQSLLSQARLWLHLRKACECWLLRRGLRLGTSVPGPEPAPCFRKTAIKSRGRRDGKPFREEIFRSPTTLFILLFRRHSTAVRVFSSRKIMPSREGAIQTSSYSASGGSDTPWIERTETSRAPFFLVRGSRDA